jgi:hypothetical protein
MAYRPNPVDQKPADTITVARYARDEHGAKNAHGRSELHQPEAGELEAVGLERASRMAARAVRVIIPIVSPP